MIRQPWPTANGLPIVYSCLNFIKRAVRYVVTINLFKNIIVYVGSKLDVVVKPEATVFTINNHSNNVGIFLRATKSYPFIASLTSKKSVEIVLSTRRRPNVCKSVVQRILVYVVNHLVLSPSKKLMKADGLIRAFDSTLYITLRSLTPTIVFNNINTICIDNSSRFYHAFFVIKVNIGNVAIDCHSIWINSTDSCRATVALVLRIMAQTIASFNNKNTPVARWCFTDSALLFTNSFAFRVSHFSHRLSHICIITRKATR